MNIGRRCAGDNYTWRKNDLSIYCLELEWLCRIASTILHALLKKIRSQEDQKNTQYTIHSTQYTVEADMHHPICLLRIADAWGLINNKRHNHTL